MFSTFVMQVFSFIKLFFNAMPLSSVSLQTAKDSSTVKQFARSKQYPLPSHSCRGEKMLNRNSSTPAGFVCSVGYLFLYTFYPSGIYFGLRLIVFSFVSLCAFAPLWLRDSGKKKLRSNKYPGVF